MEKLTIALLFWGESPEHDVSLQSAKNIFHALDPQKYNIILIGISPDGKRYLQKEHIFDLETPYIQENDMRVTLVPWDKWILINLETATKQTLDVVFPILHGTFGEDGTIQWLCKLAHVPFVGAGVLGSSVGMDKHIMKSLLHDAWLPLWKYLALSSHEQIPDFHQVQKKLGNIIFIKPANMGSSVWVHKVNNHKQYLEALQDAFTYDTKILLEEYIDGREIECAVLGNEYPQASLPGEVVANTEFYSYEAKYINSFQTKIPADIPHDMITKVQALAIKTFQVLNCEGLGRVDIFLKKNGKLIINEINTLPWFTKISMYPQLREATGISYTDLIDTLIQLAWERFQKEQILQRTYHTKNTS